MLVTIQNNQLSATINSFGAELNGLFKESKNYIWTVDTAFWNKTSPVLFPIVGQIKNDTYLFNGIEYSMSRHGFARDFEFVIIEKNENLVVFSLSENKETLQNYPFNFELQVKYSLENNTLVVSYLVKNNSKTKMPFSIGAHPAFAINSDFENHSLLFDKEENLVTFELEKGLLSGKSREIKTFDRQLGLNYDLFRKDALIFKKLNSKSITILENNLPCVKVNFNDFPNLGIWTNQNAPFLCIEPWFGYADSLNSTGNLFEKEGIQILDIKEQFNASFTVQIP
ncbi:aldose 1-epimerase family protein [Flavobacterium sp.]|uniref:aldose 1-epimerase family protein n=1 Tax=Flavobacterium sp. TaxID=239 RepID=UPI00286E4C8A|nr:aldose 1-epimerase family protein [Flavobacterium sp.]